MHGTLIDHYDCKCGEDYCEMCNPSDGPIPNKGVESGLAVREKMGEDTGGVTKTNDGHGDWPLDEHTNQKQGGVF